MSVTLYDEGKINAGLDRLRSEQRNLETQSEAIRQAADHLLSIWTGQAANAFSSARTQWNNEFADTLATLQALIQKSEEAMINAKALDARLSTNFPG